MLILLGYLVVLGTVFGEPRGSTWIVEDCLCRLYDCDDGLFSGDVADLHLQETAASMEQLTATTGSATTANC